MYFERFFNPQSLFNKLMIEILDERLPSFRDSILLTGGKHLRAGVLRMMWHAMGGSGKESITQTQVMRLGAAIEFAHSASLIVDDMIDEDDKRRGVPTIHVTEGHKRAMLDTIGVLSISYSLVAPYGEKYVDSLASTQRGMVKGVIKEMFKKPNLPATMLYNAIISQKTGQLFGLSARWGGMVAGVDEDTEKECYLYGLHLGKVMQIADDIADIRKIAAGTGSKVPGSEIMLLKCVVADGLAKDLIKDIKSCNLHPSKVKKLINLEGVEEKLIELLNKEITVCRSHIPVDDDDKWHTVLMDAPQEIADIMISEV